MTRSIGETRIHPWTRFTRMLRHKGQVALLLSKEVFEDRSTLPLRLYQRSRKGRARPGTFRAPFGKIAYLDAISAFHQLHEIFHRHIYDIAVQSAAPTIVDCGGNIGLSVIRFKQQNPDAAITVYEADPQIADILETNIRHLSKVKVVRSAVGAANGHVAFAPDGGEGGCVVSHADLMVPCTRLSDEIVATVDILKMDIEGSEFEVMQDLCATGKIALIENIMMEIHSDVDTQQQLGELWLALTEAGFRLAIHEAFPAPPRDSTEFPPFACLENSRFQLVVYAWRAQPQSSARQDVEQPTSTFCV